jgi:Ca2+/Na+ antiporter
LILSAYLLVSMGKVTGQSPIYQWMNIIGAAGFVINSGVHGAIPSTALNIVWLGIGAVALARLRWGKGPARPPAGHASPQDPI